MLQLSALRPVLGHSSRRWNPGRVQQIILVEEIELRVRGDPRQIEFARQSAGEERAEQREHSGDRWWAPLKYSAEY